MPKKKKCTKCGRKSTVDSFYKRKGTKDGLSTWCKECEKQYRKDNKEYIAKRHKLYYEANKDAISESAKKYYKDNRESIIESVKRYKRDNKEVVAEGAKKYYEAHKESIARYSKQYWESNKGNLSEYQKQYFEANKEAIKERNKKYWKINSERNLILGQKYRAKKRELPATLTSQQWDNIKQCFENRCSYCGEEKPLQQEHFIPLSKGGEYTHNNIIPACKSCNCSKHDSNFFDWYPKQKFYSREREKIILTHLGYKNNIQQPVLF